MASLKKIRVVVALVMFVLVSVVFLDFTGRVPTSWTSILVSLQLVPSLIRIATGITAMSLGLLVVLALTFAFGRVYCSTLCPLGTLQDIVIRLSGRIRSRRWYKYKSAPVLVHYGLLGFAVVTGLLGSLVLVDLLEPFSNFGRILTNLADPIIVSFNNAAVFLFGKLGIFGLFSLPLLHLQLAALLFTLAFLAFIVWLSYAHGRLFCNMLCPAGALLGLVSRVSIFKIAIVEERCTECGFCEMVCKANCIDAESKKIDFHACVGCYNCIDSCPTVALKFEGFWKNSSPEAPAPADPPRRAFLGAVVAAGSALLAPAKNSEDSAAQPLSYDASRSHPVTPPGSVSRNRFSNLCTACHLCVSACPTQVLGPSLFDYGITGIMQPKMNYNANYCNFECVICSEVCPTGAIRPLTIAAKKEIQLGKAAFVKDDCIVITKKKDCGACSEHCPTKAVKMVQNEDKLFLPQLNNDICVGCGACEHACPTTPRKAIYVVANPVHLKAQKPKVEKLEALPAPQADFPF